MGENEVWAAKMSGGKWRPSLAASLPELLSENIHFAAFYVNMELQERRTLNFS
jgi:hypothetical protein